MRGSTNQLKTVSIPKTIIRKWEEFIEEFEDFLLSADKKFIKKMRRTRKNHLAGKLTDLDI